MTRKTLILLLLIGMPGALMAAAEPLPRPPELQADIDFWTSIFTRYSTDEGILHDNRALGVVYARLDMPASLSRKQRGRRVTQHRVELQKVLRALAGGKRSKLSDEEARVLALWPADVSNETLKAAVNRIRFQQGLSDRFRDGLARSGRWRAYIEAEFSTLGVPLELVALPHVESSYNPDARSHVGASGIWQFTRSTARRFMRVDHVLDERNDPYAATRGAGRLLAYNYSITGNWPMAITAYNHGLGGVRRAMRQFGDTAYVDILRKYKGRTFGFASRNFYVAFLAAMHVDQNAETYFPGAAREAPIDYDEAILPGYMPVDELARVLDIAPPVVLKHNPSLQPTVRQGSKHLPKGFGLRIPANALTGSLEDILVNVPADRWSAKQLPDMYHAVVRGDTLSRIATTYKTRVSTLVALNGLDSRHRIRAGQRLRLPAAGPLPSVKAAASPPVASPEVVVAARAVEPAAEALSEVETPVEPPAGAGMLEEMTPTAMAGEPEPALIARTELLSDPSDYSVANDQTIEVQALETLGHYADWLGIRTQRLRDINGLEFRTPVTVGMRIKIKIADVDASEFESRRIDYHRNQQDAYFREHVIVGTTEHEIRRGESIWVLSLRKYKVPIWLFRQYNPEFDLHKVRPGMVVRFPKLVDSDRS